MDVTQEEQAGRQHPFFFGLLQILDAHQEVLPALNRVFSPELVFAGALSKTHPGMSPG